MSDFDKYKEKIKEIPTLVGTPRVDASEIAGIFPGALEAVQLLNSFSPGYLNKIAFIYKSDDTSAYGIFNPTLNETIHILEVKEELEKQGFNTVIDNNNKLYASAPNMSPEEVKKKMEDIMSRKELEGGVAFGLNVSNILRSSDEIISKNPNLTPEQQQKLKIAICASIMAHEAQHARGDKGESTPYAIQAEVLEKALAHYNIQLSNAVETHADTKGWYKKAQAASASMPFRRDVGLEIILRNNQEKNMRIFPTVGKPNDSVETLLEKNQHKKPEKTELEGIKLERGHTEEDYKASIPQTLESVLNENRAHPLIILLPKSASFRNVKIAGYYSNLGGPHIGGLFTQMSPNNDSEWNAPFQLDGKDGKDLLYDKKNPEEDSNIDHFWMRRYDRKNQNGHMSVNSVGNSVFNEDVQLDLAAVEFRNLPSKFEDRPTNWPDRSDIAVAGASNSSAYNVKEDHDKNFIVQILKQCGYYKNLVRSGKRNAARLVVTEEVLPHVIDAISDIQYCVFQNKDRYSVWVFQNTTEDKVAEIESDIVNKTNYERVSEFVGLNNTIKEIVNKIMSKCKFICEEHGIHDTYVVGGFVRTLASTKNFAELNDLDFSASRPDDCLKLGGLLASDLGVGDIGYHHRSKTLTFEYEGIKMDFRGNFTPFDIRPLLRSKGIETTPLNFDIYARDFTINSLIYSFMDNKIWDVTGQGQRDLDARLVRTYFDPNVIIPANPLVVTRALILNLRGFHLSKDLEAALHTHSQSVFNGKESNERLAYEYEKIVGYGDGGIRLLEEYNLTNLKKIRDEVERENPEFFKKE
jgi:hypothetical protein